MSTRAVTVESDDSGIRLDRWFRRHYPSLSHGHLEKLLRTGQVRIDGKRAKASERLETGQNIRVPPNIGSVPITEVETVRPQLRERDSEFIRSLVIHEDTQVFVLDKPSGLATQGGSGVTRHVDGMLAGLQGTKRQRPRLVHRLDRDTSGVLIVARTQPAAAALSQSLRSRDAKKIYWALTKGVPRPQKGVIKLALAKETGFGPKGRDERMAPVEDDEGGAKRATTYYFVVARAADAYAWVALMPVTGRTHQIRAHLAAIGTPIVGDFKYGGEAAKGRGELENRLHLHARSIDIAHPTGGRLSVSAPLPPHMTRAWKLFGFSEDQATDPFPTREKTR